MTNMFITAEMQYRPESVLKSVLLTLPVLENILQAPVLNMRILHHLQVN